MFDANATDLDTGLHGQLEYFITGGLNGGIDFTIDLQTGQVYVGAELDRETRDLYVLNLTVKDRDLTEGHRRSTMMEVSVVKEDLTKTIIKSRRSPCNLVVSFTYLLKVI